MTTQSTSDERLRKIIDYCAGMLAALDADSFAPDIPGRIEMLEDIARMARGER